MTPLPARDRIACWVALVVCAFGATVAPLPSLVALALLLWPLGGWRRDPIWWAIAALVWLRGATISAGVGLRIGVKGAVRSWNAAQAEAHRQAWGMVEEEG